MITTKVKDLMTKNPLLVNPKTTLEEVAEEMRKIDCGFLPVGSKKKLEGVITDRDIVIRAISEGVDTKIATADEYMSDRIYTCNENNTLSEVAEIMGKHQISRLVVDNEDGEIVGIITLGCILRQDKNFSEVVEVVQRARECTVA